MKALAEGIDPRRGEEVKICSLKVDLVLVEYSEEGIELARIWFRDQHGPGKLIVQKAKHDLQSEAVDIELASA